MCTSLVPEDEPSGADELLPVVASLAFSAGRLASRAEAPRLPLDPLILVGIYRNSTRSFERGIGRLGEYFRA
jgi:hypothetical protein